MFDNEDNVVRSIRGRLARELPTLSHFKESFRKELDDPEILQFRNVCRMTLAQLEAFNLCSGMFKIPLKDIHPPLSRLSKKKQKVHVYCFYHYKIGQYQMSPYYINFLSSDMVKIPGANDDTVRNQAKQLCLKCLSTRWRLWWRRWLQMKSFISVISVGLRPTSIFKAGS